LTILTVLHGQELGWICLGSCSTDVVVNAIVLFWLTRPGHANDEVSSNGGPASNHRSENGKSGGGGVVQMHRISVNPGVYGSRQTGSFNGTSSTNGMSKISTGPGTPANTDEVPRTPLKVSFSGYPHADVYDGSQPYVRDGLAPSTDDKMASSPATPTSSSFLQPQSELPSLFTDQKGHSAGFAYERKVTISGDVNNSSSPSSFLNRIIGKRSPSEGGKKSFGNIPGAFGGRKRRGSDDDVGVRITITTTHEKEDVLTDNDIEAGDPRNSSEDQSKKGPPGDV
jgi:hypothetical protein